MKLARYVGEGRVEIVDEPMPTCPEGGLLIKVEACGLCSGELMSWYMDQKIPHVLGHELAGIVIESNSVGFEAGTRVFPHHHAPCLHCEMCARGLFVHCPTWKGTHLVPGGMAEYCAVPKENLADCLLVNDLDPKDAALIEPLACVMKSIDQARELAGPILVIGLGVMGLLHLLALKNDHEVIGVDLNPSRVAHARSLGISAMTPDELAGARFGTIFVCPGSQKAFDLAYTTALPGGTIVLFAPLAPGERLIIPQQAYFRDLTITHAYSCGPGDTKRACEVLRRGVIRAVDVVSDFIELQDLPLAYQKMKAGEILKAMVLF